MSGHISLTISGLSADELSGLITSLAQMGIGNAGVAPVNFGQAGIPAGTQAMGSVAPPQGMPAMPPPGRPTALPPMSGNSAVPPPPPAAAPIPSANPRLESVVKLMDAYSKANNNGVAGVRKVLDVVGLKRAQDADEAQLEWLEKAFANTAWTPS